MKLYEAPRNSKIVVKTDNGIEHVLNFHHIDGMYSYCTTNNGEVVHLAAWEEVVVLGPKMKSIQQAKRQNGP